jgi:hypothetical protein
LIFAARRSGFPGGRFFLTGTRHATFIAFSEHCNSPLRQATWGAFFQFFAADAVTDVSSRSSILLVSAAFPSHRIA